MIQIISKHTENPTEEFTGIWYNTESGSLYVWADKPIVIGHSKEGCLVRADVFEARFQFEEKRNLQTNSYEFDYHGLPMLVVGVVEKEKYTGSAVDVYFGNKYGSVSEDGTIVLVQTDNVILGEKLKIKCVPTSGSLMIILTVLSYE